MFSRAFSNCLHFSLDAFSLDDYICIHDFKYNLESNDFQIYIICISHLKFSCEFQKYIVNTYLIFTFDCPMRIPHKSYPKENYLFTSFLFFLFPLSSSIVDKYQDVFLPTLSTSRSVNSTFLLNTSSTSLLQSLPLPQSCSHQYCFAKPVPDVANDKTPCHHLNIFLSLQLQSENKSGLE